MAGNPHPPHQFPKGHKFGKGRPRVSDDVKAARKFNSSEFELAASKIFFISFRDLVQLVNNEHTPVIEAIIGRVILQGIKNGTTDELNYFVERFMGKVIEHHNFTGNANPDLVKYIAEVNKAHAEREVKGVEKEFKKSNED